VHYCEVEWESCPYCARSKLSLCYCRYLGTRAVKLFRVKMLGSESVSNHSVDVLSVISNHFFTSGTRCV